MNAVRSASRSPLVGVVGAKVVTFPVSAVCGLLWLRLVIGSLSTADYAFVAVVVGLQFVLYLLDFGTSSTVLEEAGRYRVHRDLQPVASALGRAWRVIVLGNLVILLVATGLALAGAWGPILGFPEESRAAGLGIVATLAVNLVARPMALGTALVVGLGRPSAAPWAQALAAVVSVGLVAWCVAVDAPLPLIVITPVLGQTVAALVPLALSARLAPGVLRAALRETVRRAGQGRRLRDLAVPMLLIQVIAPLGTGLDRVVLSHVSTVEAVAVFALAAQLAASAESFITVLQPALWAQFAEARAHGGMLAALRLSYAYVRRLWPLGVAFGAAFTVAAYLIAPIVADGRIDVPLVLWLIFGATYPLAVVHIILGNALTDPAGLRSQVWLLLFTTPLNVGLTIALSPSLGAEGPALATLVTGAIHLPLLWLLARRRMREALVSPAGAAPAPAHAVRGEPSDA